MDGITIGYIGIMVLLLFLALGTPVYLSLAITGALGIMVLFNFNAALGNLAPLVYDWGTKWTLVTIPLFLLMGSFLFHSHISRDLYESAYKFLGHFPGGLAMATVAACTAFGACCASSLANAAAFGVIAVPEMRKYKYNMELATGTVAAGGTIGVMMPPSIGLIVLGTLTGQSIGELYIAAIIPALVIMLVYWIVIAGHVTLNPSMAPHVPAFSWKERLVSFVRVWPVAAIFLLVLGGIYIGFFTPTEAGAVGCTVSFLFLVARKRLSKQIFVSAINDTIRTTGMIFILFIGASIFSNFLALSGVPANISKSLTELNLPPSLILLLILGIYIPMGCLVDLLSGWMVTVPIFFPVVQALGFNPIWWCILMQLLGELGLITPPVGLNVFVLKGVTDVPLDKIFKGIVPFIIGDFIVFLLLWFFPQISLWLPMLMRGH